MTRMRIYRKQIERITIIFPNDERHKAFQYCADNGYHITRSGPKYKGKHRYDMSKGKIVAERETPDDPDKH